MDPTIKSGNDKHKKFKCLLAELIGSIRHYAVSLARFEI